MKTTTWSMFLAFVFLTILVSGCASAPTPVPPTPTFTPSPTDIPAPTSTPTPSPHSLVVIKSALSGDLLTILIQDTDLGGEKLDTFELGGLCFRGDLYVVDESGSRLKCVAGTDVKDSPDQIEMIFSGASSEHTYQLIRGEDAPIELLPEKLTP